MTLQDLDKAITDKIFSGGVYINKNYWLQLVQFVNTRSYDSYGEFFWYLNNKIRPLPVPDILTIN